MPEENNFDPMNFLLTVLIAFLATVGALSLILSMLYLITK
jgi:hypothetical protein